MAAERTISGSAVHCSAVAPSSSLRVCMHVPLLRARVAVQRSEHCSGMAVHEPTADIGGSAVGRLWVWSVGAGTVVCSGGVADEEQSEEERDRAEKRADRGRADSAMRSMRAGQ